MAMRNRDIALAMLALAAVRGYGWEAFAPELKGWASKGIGGLALLSMIWIVVALRPSVAIALAASVWSFYELQVALCSFLYMVDPWPLLPGQPICSVRFDVDLGAFGIVLIAWASWFIYSRSRHG